MKTDRDQSIERLLRDSPPRQSPPDDDCPDAETLAALADDTLSSVERQSLETHIADCHQCQALTAAMVRTASAVPSSHRDTGDSLALLPWWRRGGALRWIVPATAAAAAVALWVAVPEPRPAQFEERKDVQTSAASAPAAVDPPAAQPVPSLSDDRAPAQTQAAKAGAAASAASADARSAAPAESLDQAQQGTFARQERAAAGEQDALADPNRPVIEVTGQTAPLLARAAAPPAAAFEVVSPDPRVRWRVGPGAAVQYSADGGASWIMQDTGAAAPLTAGHAPSPLVCWLVGRAGTVLRSEDGGRVWQRVAFPEVVELVAVTASSALTSTVEVAGGRRLNTTDGGRTWAPVP